ncbi:MAG: hypothetical protein ABUT11_01945 [Leifsonia sp.]
MTSLLRVSLILLAANELVVGAWNLFAPRSFYNDFPTVNQTPPFSEHFARDFGAATLGIAALLIVAAIRPGGPFPLPAGIAFSVFAIPHFVFHAAHLDHASAADVAFLLIGNGVAALLGMLVIVLAVLRIRRDRRSVHDPALG